MAFGFNSGSGDFVPRIKWNAKAGRAYRIDRIQDAMGNWSNEDVDITDAFSFVPDFANLQRGFWNKVSFAEKLALMSEPIPERPSDVDSDGKSLWAPQVKLHLVLSRACGGGLRSWSISANSVMAALEKVYQEWQADARSKELYPILTKSGVKAEKSKQGTNFVPTFTITKWVPRPPDLKSPASESEEEEEAPAFGVGATGDVSSEFDAPVTIPPAAVAPAASTPTVAADADDDLPF